MRVFAPGSMNVICDEAEVESVVLDLPTTVLLTITPLRTGERSGTPIRIELRRLGRVLASLREGRWDDRRAKAKPLSLEELSALLQPYNETVYGDLWNQPLKTNAHWTNRVSFDWRSGADLDDMNRLELFKNPPGGHLDVLIWFTDVRIIDETGNELSPDAVAAEVKAWWASMQSGETPMGEHGIYLLAPGQFRRWWKRILRR